MNVYPQRNKKHKEQHMNSKDFKSEMIWMGTW